MGQRSVSFSQFFQSRHFIEFIEEIVRKVIRRAPPFLLYYDRFFIKNYDFATPTICNRRFKSIRTRVAGTADLPALKRFLERGEEYTVRFRKGDQVVVAELHDEIVGMQWIEVGEEHYEEEHEYHFPLPNGAAWIYDTYVAPTYRGMGVWACMMDESVHNLRQRSFHATYCMIQTWNLPSINCHRHYGYWMRRHVIYIRFMFFRIYLEKNLDPLAKNDTWQVKFVFRKLRRYKGTGKLDKVPRNFQQRISR